MQRFLKSKKVLALLAVVVGGAVAGGAYAYFTGSGTGTGSAKVATPASLTVTQVGAGYDSLIPGNGYHQDQCFECAQISEFGNDITLANPGAQKLTSVVVAFRNWGAAFSDVPITLTINRTTNGPVSKTVTPAFAGAVSGIPTVTNVTFDFSSDGVKVEREFVYGISFDHTGDAKSLNVALSSSSLNLAVGTDTTPGTVWVNTTSGAGIAGDFPACTTPGTGFAQVTTNCGPSAGTNPGAYGTNAQVAAGSADIPAVEFNVVGGIVTGLTPGGPSQPVDFAITNPGSAGVFVNQVTTAIGALTGTGSGSSEACAASMYGITGSPVTIGATVPPGTTIYSPSGTSISMTDDGNNQDNCEGATVGLNFTAN